MRIELTKRTLLHLQQMRGVITDKLRVILGDKNISEILIGSAWALGARVIGTALAMVTSVVVARFYGAEVMGIVASINAFLGLAATLSLMGTNTSILRLIPEHMAKYSASSACRIYTKTLFLVTGAGLLAGMAFFAASPSIAQKVYSKPDLSPFFVTASFFIVFISVTNLNTQSVRGLKLVRTFAFLQLLPSLSTLLILVLLTLCWFHPSNPVYALLASPVITAFASTIIIARKFRRNMDISGKIHEMSVKSITSMSLPMLMTSSMGFAMTQMNIIVLGIFRPVGEVAYYDLAVKLSTLTTFLLQSVNIIAAPKFAELYHSDRLDVLFCTARASAKLIFWSTIPILLVLVTLGNQVIAFLYGKQFTSAYFPLVVLLFGQFINAASGSTGYFMNMTGHEKAFSNIMLSSSVVNVILAFTLTPYFGPCGAALASSFSLIVWNISCLLFIKAKFRRFIGYIPILNPE